MAGSEKIKKQLIQWRTTLIVVAIFIALAAYVLLVDMKRDPQTDQISTPTPMPILGLSIDNVQSLRIASSAPAPEGLRVLQIINMRQELEWRFSTPDAIAPSQDACLTDPDGCLSDPYVIHMSVNDLCQLAAQRILLEEATDLGQYGLEPAVLEIELITLLGEQAKIHIGKQTVDGMSYYVQQAGDPRIFLVAQYTLQPFFEWLREPPYAPPPVPG